MGTPPCVRKGAKIVIFTRQNKSAIENPTVAQIKRGIAGLRSYGRTTFACLSDEDGGYIQVGGGGVTCLLELFIAAEKKHFRGYSDRISKVFPDGTLLVFGAGKIPMQADEWLYADEVAEAFCAFLTKAPLPESIRWRPAPGLNV